MKLDKIFYFKFFGIQILFEFNPILNCTFVLPKFFNFLVQSLFAVLARCQTCFNFLILSLYRIFVYLQLINFFLYLFKHGFVNFTHSLQYFLDALLGIRIIISWLVTLSMGLLVPLRLIIHLVLIGCGLVSLWLLKNRWLPLITRCGLFKNRHLLTESSAHMIY